MSTGLTVSTTLETLVDTVNINSPGCPMTPDATRRKPMTDLNLDPYGPLGLRIDGE